MEGDKGRKGTERKTKWDGKLKLNIMGGKKGGKGK